MARNKKIIENFSYLSMLQIFNMLLPFITYPYLIRVLGTELYGSIVFVQAVIAYFSIIINYGFEASATKDISVHRDNKAKIAEIVSSAYIIKGALWLALLLILLASVNVFPGFRAYKLLYLFTFLATFYELLFPVWYFQGLEKMRYITLINLLVKSISLVAIFIFIRQKEDYLFVPLLNGAGAFLGGVIAWYFVFIKDKIAFLWPSFSTIKWYLKDNLPIFFSNIIVAVKDKFNVILIGSFAGMQEVAIYDLGVKVMNVFIQPNMIANSAIFPRMAREKNIPFIRKFITVSFLLTLSAVILSQPFLPYVLDFLSNNLEGTTRVTRILLLSPVIVSVSVALARNVLLTFNQYRYFFLSNVYTTVFYLVLLVFMYCFSLLNNILWFAAITVATYLFELIYKYYICKKMKLISIPFKRLYNIVLYRLLPEKTFLRIKFREKTGYRLNLKNPATFNEKMQWLKLHDRTVLHTLCADKHAVRGYVTAMIGGEYLIPLVYSTEKAEELTPEALPDYPVIIKTNHSSGEVFIVRDKETADFPGIRKALKRQLKSNLYPYGKEWQYKDIPPRIIVEQLMTDEQGDIPMDYKLHCFNGKVRMIHLDVDRFTRHTRIIYDEQWNVLPFSWGYESSEKVIAKPLLLSRMIDIAERLAFPFIYVRVDLYLAKGQLYFGELTFHHGSGFEKFEPQVFDKITGDLLTLPPGT
ncbi:MAG: oligosaccharide flippase family protein [Tannerellaceae bacterium]|nr:oligosaccharide flippase family protein [Tannerellaceae bacterium]